MPQTAPLVGVGVLVVKGAAAGARVLVGKRKGSHGTGTWALPGGHLELGESFEKCGAREVLEECGIQLDEQRMSFVTATNNVFSDTMHYVTIFMRATVPEETTACVMEPHKCEGWEWVAWRDAGGDGGFGVPQPRFLPLQALLQLPLAELLCAQQPHS